MVFSCGCKAEIWVTKGLLVKAMGNILGLEIIRIRVGYSILSLEDNLSGDYDVEKNGKWSYIFSWKPGVSDVCTRLDMASVDV
ncbi:hypothetical protein Tco_0402285, partial [Tanacetum coccineum]